MSIRLIQEVDLQACGTIYTQVFNVAPYRGYWEPEEATEMLRGLLARDPQSCWCMDEGGEVQGFAFCTTYGSFRATIQEFAIAPHLQRRGLGTTLMEFLLREFNQRRLRAIDLVANRDAPAFEFYRKFGFQPPERYAIMAKWLR